MYIVNIVIIIVVIKIKFFSQYFLGRVCTKTIIELYNNYIIIWDLFKRMVDFHLYTIIGLKYNLYSY